MWCRGIRGATTVENNDRDEILDATTDLLTQMIEANDIKPENVAYAMFTVTSGLNAEFPALAARSLGWTNVALLCGHEIDVPGSLKECIRILVLLNTERSVDEIVHVYIKGAVSLRPDANSLKG